MRKLLIALLFLLQPNAFAESAKLGFVVPLTGSASLMGSSLRGVSKLANPGSFVSVFEDDKCEGKSALSAYLKLKNDGVRVFYMACSGSILAVAPLAKRNGDLIFTSYAGSSRIRATGDEVIRLNPDAISVADGVARLIDDAHRPTAILYEEQEYASSFADRLEQLLGANVATKVSYRPDATSFRSEILRIRQKMPKSIVLAPVGDGAARVILKELSQNGVKVPIIGEVNLCDFPFKPKEFGLHGRCVAARFNGEEFTRFMSDYSKALGYDSAYPFYDAMAFDLIKYLDRRELMKEDVVTIKQSVLAGFKGSFAEYHLTTAGEPLDSSSYLVVNEY